MARSVRSEAADTGGGGGAEAEICGRGPDAYERAEGVGEATRAHADKDSTAARAAAIELEEVGVNGGTSIKGSNFSEGTEACLVAERVL